MRYTLDEVHEEIRDYYLGMHRSILDLYERRGQSRAEALQVRTVEAGRLKELWAIADYLHEEEAGD